MHRLITGTAAATVFVLLAASPGAAQFGEIATNGKESAFAYSFFNLVPFTPDPVLTLTIARGKKKRVLLVDATLVSNEDGPVTIAGGVQVNGIAMNPNAAVNTHCAVEFACSASGHWWLDLDQAEALNPGALINQPLVIRLFARHEPAGQADVSVRAWLQKK